MTPETVITFWFEECTPQQWFMKDEQFDETLRSRFLEVHQQAMAGETAAWRSTATGRLAEIIVLDQFSRNMFRGTPAAFASDSLALSLAEEALRQNADKQLTSSQRYFMYLPFMHSESSSVHKKALWLFLRFPINSWWSWIKYEYKHKVIIDRFGRYPHRNEALNRTSTAAEIAFIKSHPGF